MSNSQNTKNEQQNDLCITSEQLTEQWKKGELPDGTYYVELNDGNVIMMGYGKFAGWYNVKEVLAKVPSYDELQNINKSVNDLMASNIKLVEENKQLKELLKRAKVSVDYHCALCREYTDGQILLSKINQALGEE